MATDSTTIARPAFRYFGGKFRIRKWVVQYFPPHRTYVEPFGGAASILLHKKPSRTEIYNDQFERIYNVFCVLRDPEQSAELERLLRITPYSRREFDHSFERSEDPIEDARRTLVLASMGYGADSVSRGHKTGFRGRLSGRKTVASEWSEYPEQIQRFCARLKGVVLECRDAFDLIGQYDGPDTLYYIDPPYAQETRSVNHGYAHELDHDDHVRLIERLRELNSMVILSGYRCEVYDQLLSDWHRTDKRARADRGGARVESLWLSPLTVSKLETINLFEHA